MFSLIETVEQFAREAVTAGISADVPVGKARFVNVLRKWKP